MMQEPMNTNPTKIKVHLLPSLFEPEELAGGIAVILDILRASTTIVHALANGAESVMPVASVEEALHLKQKHSGASCLLGGEREGLLIPGFDLDNNPLAYHRDCVHGKTVIFTTTNGTAALAKSLAATQIVVGSFANLQGVVNYLIKCRLPIHLVCAGTKGKISLEDAACAGAIVSRISQDSNTDDFDFSDDQLQLARDCYQLRTRQFHEKTATQPTVESQASIAKGQFNLLISSYGGRNCHRLGFDNQVEVASRSDAFSIVPVYDAATRKLRISS